MTIDYFAVDGVDPEIRDEPCVTIEPDMRREAHEPADVEAIPVTPISFDESPSDWAPVQPAQAAPAVVTPHPVVEPVEADMIDAAIVKPKAEPRAASASPLNSLAAATVILGCVGTSMVIGGVLALSLALWPDGGVRNELQQVDFRLHELSQTVLGSMLLLGGLIVFVLALMCHLRPRGDPST